MGDNEESQKLSLPFGDVIKRLAVAIHSQLQNILHNMRIQSPELRTQSLLAFISRSKRKLAQLLAITRWLDMPGVAQFFTNMSQLQLKISSRENRLNENQDALYFTHSQLFSRRIRTLDVVSAKDILARGTYPHLPASIFSSEMLLEDVLESGDAADTALRKSLNIYLRSKLALGDAVPSDIDFSSIENGVLKLRVNNMYELLLTLDHLDTSSPWNVLRLKLCVVSHPQESFHSIQNLSGIENDILLVLRRIAEVKPMPIADVKQSLEDHAVSASSEQGPIETDATLGITRDNTMETDACHSAITPIQMHALLPRFHTICQHTAYATALRYLYVQALETSRTIWSGLCQADFQEKRFYSQFVFRFWRSRNTGYYQYELRVIQLRSPKQTYVPLDIEIVTVDSDGEEIGGDVGLTDDVRETNKEKMVNLSQNLPLDSDITEDIVRKPFNLILELWTCSAPDDSEGSLRITRRRVIGKNIPCSKTSETSETPVTNVPNNNQKDLGFVGLFDITEFITNGVTFCSMFHKVLEQCATNRLWVLHNRVMRSPGVSDALSSGQTGLTLVLEPLRLIISVKCAKVIVFVDYLSGTFSVGSNQLSDVAKGASKGCSLFLSEINNVESERLSGEVHASVFMSVPLSSTSHSQEPHPHVNTSISASSSSSSSASSSSSSTSDNAAVNNSNSSSNSSSSSGSNSDELNATLYLLPLSTSSTMIQYLAAAYWSTIMKRSLCVDNVELYAIPLYGAARILCSNSRSEYSDGEINENKMNGVLNGDPIGISSSNIVPLVYDVCSWPVDPTNQPNILKDLASNSYSNIAASLRAVTHTDAAPAVNPISLEEELENITKQSIQNNENFTGLFANTDIGERTEFSFISLIMCLSVDTFLNPHIYAILCGISPGSTVFLPPRALKAINVPFDITEQWMHIKKQNSQYCILDDDISDRMVEEAIDTSSKWARSCMISAPNLQTFGLFIPPSASDVLNTQKLVSSLAPTSEPSIIVLWTDAVSLLAIQFNTVDTDAEKGNDNKNKKEKDNRDREKFKGSHSKIRSMNQTDANTMQVSLLCPIPLPGVGTLGASGPPRCVIGVPRSVTSEEANRLKRRCISIGEISLTISRYTSPTDPVNPLSTDTPTKKRRKVISPLYSFRCGKVACIDTFTAMSGLEQSDLYAALGQEVVQHCLYKYPFPAPFSNPLNCPQGMSVGSGDPNALSSFGSAYCTCRPLLEFILLITNCPNPHSGLTSNGTGTGTGVKGSLRLLALDCTSRSEVFITCALYEDCRKNEIEKDDGSSSKSDSPSTSVRLVGYVEVETSRSIVPITDIPDTPKTRRDSATFDHEQSISLSIEEPLIKKIEKVNLRLSSMTSLFEDQILEMDVFRECFQKKFQAMGGRNPFHAFINKLIALSAPKIAIT